MTLTKKDLENICQLAHLETDDEHHASLLNDINDIMDFVEQLRKYDTTNIAPLFHPFDLHQRLREDIATEESCINELESLAPLFEDGHYLVPRVIED